ncbi:MAG: HlyD family efflux transporter periplasmic adaptor subunit [Nannocystaceae bacterium]
MTRLRLLLPVVILCTGVACCVFLVSTSASPLKKPGDQPGTLVETRVAAPVTRERSLNLHGVVMPAQQVTVTPEVGGRVTWMHSELVVGGRLKQGEPMLRVDGRAYRFAAAERESAVEEATLRLKLEEAQHQVAQYVWKSGGGESRVTEQGRALALREPQLKAAKVRVSAAKSARARERLSIERTSLRAPFDAWVRSEGVELGQVVGPESELVILVGTGAYWVQVALRVDQVSAVGIPGIGTQATGTTAIVRQGSGGDEVVREGKVVRLLGDLDPESRMARVLVEIDDPLRDVASPRAGQRRIPLLVGAFVAVELKLGEVAGVYELERAWLRDGDRVFVMSPSGVLEVRDVEVAWGTSDHVFVSRGLEPGDRLVTTRVGSPLPGMKLRTTSASPAAESEPTDSLAAAGSSL